MTDTKKTRVERRNIIELGYRPTDTLDRSRPPQGGSGVRKPSIKRKDDKK